MGTANDIIKGTRCGGEGVVSARPLLLRVHSEPCRRGPRIKRNVSNDGRCTFSRRWLLKGTSLFEGTERRSRVAEGGDAGGASCASTPLSGLGTWLVSKQTWRPKRSRRGKYSSVRYENNRWKAEPHPLPKHNIYCIPVSNHSIIPIRVIIFFFFFCRR